MFEESKDNIEYSDLSDEMKKIIDNNVLASIMIDNNIIIIPNSLGKRITPSFLAFFGENKICNMCRRIGKIAKV